MVEIYPLRKKSLGWRKWAGRDEAGPRGGLRMGRRRGRLGRPTLALAGEVNGLERRPAGSGSSRSMAAAALENSGEGAAMAG